LKSSFSNKHYVVIVLDCLRVGLGIFEQNQRKYQHR